MALPAELRNEIYELALVSDNQVLISSEYEQEMLPGLFTTSKQIRLEASTIYYNNNTFKAHVEVKRIESFALWLRSRTAELGLRPFEDLRIVIPLSCWEEIFLFFPIIKVVHETGIEVREKPYDINDAETATFLLCTCYGWESERTLEEAVMLGRTAREEKWSAERLRDAFEICLTLHGT